MAIENSLCMWCNPTGFVVCVVPCSACHQVPVPVGFLWTRIMTQLNTFSSCAWSCGSCLWNVIKCLYMLGSCEPEWWLSWMLFCNFAWSCGSCLWCYYCLWNAMLWLMHKGHLMLCEVWGIHERCQIRPYVNYCYECLTDVNCSDEESIDCM